MKQRLKESMSQSSLCLEIGLEKARLDCKRRNNMGQKNDKQLKPHFSDTESVGRRQHFQARGHSFSLYGPTLRRPITFLSFSPCRKLAYKFVYATLPLNRLTRILQTIRKKFNGQTSE